MPSRRRPAVAVAAALGGLCLFGSLAQAFVLPRYVYTQSVWVWLVAETAGRMGKVRVHHIHNSIHQPTMPLAQRCPRRRLRHQCPDAAAADGGGPYGGGEEGGLHGQRREDGGESSIDRLGVFFCWVGHGSSFVRLADHRHSRPVPFLHIRSTRRSRRTRSSSCPTSSSRWVRALCFPLFKKNGGGPASHKTPVTSSHIQALTDILDGMTDVAQRTGLDPNK